MPNYRAFLENLGEVSSDFADYAKQEKTKTDAFQMLLLKSAIEQKMKENMMQRSLSTIREMGFGIPQQSTRNVIDTATTVEPISGQRDYEMIVEPKIGEGGELSFGFKREMTPSAKLREKVKETKAVELAKGIPPDKSGLYNLAKESLSGIDNVINTIYPKTITGTNVRDPKSFRRGIAFGSNLPAISLPFIGPITPKMLPIRSAEMQDVFRDTGAALAARQLIQTGVAARPDETENLRNQFAASLTSNPTSTLKGLQKLKKFYVNYIYILETKGLQSAQEWAKSQPLLQEEYADIIEANRPSSDIFDDLLPK